MIDRDRLHRWWTIPDEVLATLPEISRHDRPLDGPEEYDCGCVAITRITDRDASRGEQPFEMRLALSCGTQACEVRPRIDAHRRESGPASAWCRDREESVEAWLAALLLTAWRCDRIGVYHDPEAPADIELETRLWCVSVGISPCTWRSWCVVDYETACAKWEQFS